MVSPPDSSGRFTKEVAEPAQGLVTNKRVKMWPINRIIDPVPTINSNSEDDLDEWVKDFCIQTVLTEVNKMV